MKYVAKRFTALLMAMLMVVNILPVSAFAGPDESNGGGLPENFSLPTFALVLDFGSELGKIPSGQYYARVTARDDYNNEYYYVTELAAGGDKKQVQIDFDGKWYNEAVFNPSWHDYSIQVIRRGDEQQAPETGGTSQFDVNNNYETTQVYSYNTSYSNTATTVGALTKLTLSLTNLPYYDDALDPYDVLGDAAEFGVIADTYIRRNHTETNFAVKTYSEKTAAGIDVDAAGGGDIPFYVKTIDNTDGERERFILRDQILPTQIFTGIAQSTALKPI